MLLEDDYAPTSIINDSQDMSALVDNNTINLAEAGVDPAVLIDNDTYPVPIHERSDSPIALPLRRFDTENTLVRNAEVVELSYDKKRSVTAGHRRSLDQKFAMLAAHEWAPGSNTANMPILESTGAVRADNNNKRFTTSDIARLAEAWDLLSVPEEDRILALHPLAIGDLREESRELFNMFMAWDGATPQQLFGFRLRKLNLMPLYDSSNVKKAFGAAAVAGDKTPLALAWVKNSVVRARGTTDMFERLRDPEARGDVIGFQQRVMALPLRARHRAAILPAVGY